MQAQKSTKKSCYSPPSDLLRNHFTKILSQRGRRSGARYRDVIFLVGKSLCVSALMDWIRDNLASFGSLQMLMLMLIILIL